MVRLAHFPLDSRQKAFPNVIGDRDERTPALAQLSVEHT